MSTTLYYFTGTGNTLWVAKNLQKLLPDSELIPFKKMFQESFIPIKSEKVGFLYPVYDYGIPVVIAKTIAKMDISKCNYLFGIATCGAPPFLMAGGPQYLEKILQNQGKKLNLFNYIWMPGNNILYYQSFPDWLVKIQLSRALKQVKRSANIINLNQNSQEMVNKGH